MVKHECKCCIVGRLKWDPKYPERPVFVRTFDKNNAHLEGDSPKDALEFQNIKIIKIIGCEVDYFTEGSDIVLNNLTCISVEKDPKEETTLLVKCNCDVN